jgi:hypothetical protein
MHIHRTLVSSIILASILLPAAAQIAPAPSAANTAAPARTIPAADQPSREQLLTLFHVMRIRSQMEDLLKTLPATLEQQLQSEEDEVQLSLMPMGGELTAEQKAARDKVTNKYIELAEKQYPVDEMLDDLVAVYQRHLSREDVEGIVAFYRSEAGQHLLDAQPLMAREVMPAVTEKFEARDKVLIERYKRELNDVIGAPKIPPPAAPKS